MAPITLGELLTLALEMETKAYAFYEDLEAKFDATPDFSECIHEVKQDELLHQRILKEVMASLSQLQLSSPVDQKPYDTLKRIIDFLDTLDMEALNTTEAIYDAINTLEQEEFDMVLEFVNINDIQYKFTQEYLRNESVDHTRRVYAALSCIE